MSLGGNIVAIVMIVGGLIWMLQGANIIGGSFMTGQSQWLYIGIAVLICGLGLLWWINLRGISRR
jgi:hypothetical protein